MTHEQRIYLCRSGFVLFCLCPTLYLAVWIACFTPRRLSSAQTVALEEQISRQLGLDVDIGRVSFPRRSIALLEDVRLGDPETGAEVAHCRSLEAAQTDHGLVLLAESPQIRIESLGAVWETANRRILLRRVHLDQRVRFIARSITLVSGAGDLPPQAETFIDFECLLEQESDRAEVALQLRREDTDLADLATFKASREKEPHGAVTRIEFNNARSTPLPCWALAEHLPAVKHLGGRAEFQGRATLSFKPSGWSGEIDGRLTQVDLESLVSRRFPHKLTGEAEIATYHSARFEDGRLIEASGVLNSDGGVVSTGLLRAAAELFPVSAIEPAAEVAPYDRLSIGFTISQGGLMLSGNCDPPGVFLRDVSGPLLVERSRQASPVVSLVRMLAPISDVQVPATQETEPLLRALPIPSYASPLDQREQPAGATLPAEAR